VPGCAPERIAVIRSTERILTTHVGSLPRPVALLDLMREKENGRPYDEERYSTEIAAAVADRVGRQVECGIDVVTDGEMSKVMFLDYVKDRLAGFETVDEPKGQPASWQAEIAMFPEYYADYMRKYSATVAPRRTIVATGPVSYMGDELLAIDVANLKAAVDGLEVTEVFMPSAGPSGFGANRYYASRDEYVEAVAEAMRQEYLGIVAAGFLVQIDDPWLISMLTDPTEPVEAREKAVARHVEILNHALRGIPPEKIRHHTCYGLNHGPRLTDITLGEALKFAFQINAGGYSFEVMNPRHMHEWRHVERVGVPDGKVIIPGLIGHATNYVEHPELVAEYICNYAGIVGRENVIAGADCGFSSRASYEPEVHPTVVWPKFRALAEGARLASARLWKQPAIR
jgi:5-methyltetrahydropteroyltriglutamate--homocysteine methyltransferase